MTLFAKVDPMVADFEVNSIATVRAPVRSSAEPLRGEELIVWSAEDAGGTGLSALGIVTGSQRQTFPNARTPGAHEEFVMDILVTAARPMPFTKEDAAPFRDVADDSAVAEVSRVAYYHSLRRIVRISDGAARFLRERFLDQ